MTDAVSGWGYVVVPFDSYLMAGTLKFIINSVRLRRPAFKAIGLGGLPSTHTTIVTAAAALVAIHEGLNSAPFCVALALAFIVVIDAMDLRRKVGRHAQLMRRAFPDDPEAQLLREQMGHSMLEIAAGIAIGILTAYAVYWLENFLII
jgi:acid phosphatase family membrane protein YuiD